MKISEDFQFFTKEHKMLKSQTHASILMNSNPYKVSSATHRSVITSEINTIRARLSKIIRNKSSFKSLSNEKSKYILPAKITPKSTSEPQRIFNTFAVDYQLKLRRATETLSVPEKAVNNMTKLSPISIKTKLNPVIIPKNPKNLKKKIRKKQDSSLDSSSFSISGWNFN